MHFEIVGSIRAPETMPGSNFVVCLRNAGYEASLDRGARYRRLPDEEAARHHQVRIVDESGEDYLYPESCFSALLQRVWAD